MDSSALPQDRQSSPSVDFTAPVSRPALLPAFEPISSSPSLPRPTKRHHDGSPVGRALDLKRYPTPIPTSSTSIVPSSSPRRVHQTRPSLHRSVSGVSHVSERVPLGDVPSVELASNGEPLLLGRSSNSSHYQLSSNRLISRIHVRASYKPTTSEVLIECLGWNGCTIHCKGQPYQLGKGDTFTSDKPEVDIMLDVQDARVLVQWPGQQRRASMSAFSDATWAEDSPQRTRTPGLIPSSPPVPGHLHSPVSPSPRRSLVASASATFLGALPSDQPPVEVYEDNASADEEPPPQQVEPAIEGAALDSISKASLSSSSLSSVPNDLEDFSDHNEENDPLIHSFHTGPSLLPRLASMSTSSSYEQARREPLADSVSPSQPTTKRVATTASRSFSDLGVEISPIRNHVVNQLAYSRLHSLPLSTIFNALPASLKIAPASAGKAKSHDIADGEKVENLKLTGRSFNQADLAILLSDTACVGNIQREGKDAAGKALEDQFYYIPEGDADDLRRGAVQNSLGGTGLRSVRKQHKQYYWKRPRC